MKIKLWDRMVLFVGALLCMSAGAWTAADGVCWLLDTASSMALWVRIAKTALGALAVLFGLFLLAFPRKYAYHKRDFVVQHTDTGELRIAVKAIENLVQKCIDMHDEIQVEGLKIKNSREGVTVDMSIALANNIAIPLAVSSLQKQIKQYLIASSGIEVKEVRVSVETTQPGVEINESPYLVDSQDEHGGQDETAAAETTKKVPLHQRLFRKSEEAVTVPEPPKEEVSQEEPAQEEEVSEPELTDAADSEAEAQEEKAEEANEEENIHE